LVWAGGHAFRVNVPGVPADVTAKLEKRFDDDTTYEYIPDELKKFEIKDPQAKRDLNIDEEDEVEEEFE
jgi:hypothetical protein